MSSPEKWICPGCGTEWETHYDSCPACKYSEQKEKDLSSKANGNVNTQEINVVKNNGQYGQKLTEQQRLQFTQALKLGDQHILEDNTRIALQCYEKAYEIDPENPELLEKLGDLSDKRGQFKEAFDFYRKAYQINPNMPNIKKKMEESKADSLDHTQDYSAPKKSNNFAQKPNENYNPPAKFTYTTAELETIKNSVLNSKPPTIEKEKRKASNFLKKSGDQLYKQGETALAIDKYNQAFKIDPYNTELLEKMGDILDSRFKTTDAMELYELALKINPRLSEVKKKVASIKKQSEKSLSSGIYCKRCHKPITGKYHIVTPRSRYGFKVGESFILCENCYSNDQLFGICCAVIGILIWIVYYFS